ncbi:MAG: molybdopterin-synthase adenylyltransferase MoeB, partial [Acidimicrobiia bacterium]|nr:molybdopterin-synthase adenylyltransferase MoeB [Acidimicrobiia bacterium]
SGALVVDVRESGERDQGAIADSIFISRGLLEGAVATAITDQDVPVVVYCASGARSALAAQTLMAMGYRNVASLAGGFDAWKSAGLEWGPPEGLTSEQRTRYDRHINLPAIGEKGQERLLDSKVAVVGVGGLGSPVAMYLAAAGVGTLGLIDDDTVDATNLQRQVAHNVNRIGQAKVDSGRATIDGLNPDVKVRTYRTRLTADNVLDLLTGYDVVVDGSDNFPTRYLVNDASLHLRTPVIHGSIFRFEGQVSVFDPYSGPCYRCLFRQPPPAELAPNCAEAGVLGVLPGIIGSIQAVETIKMLLEIGEPLVGRLLTYDALSQESSILNLNRDAGCPACGPAEPPELVDYDAACRATR